MSVETIQCPAGETHTIIDNEAETASISPPYQKYPPKIYEVEYLPNSQGIYQIKYLIETCPLASACRALEKCLLIK